MHCWSGMVWLSFRIQLSKSGHNVSIFEKNTDIFQGSSGFNQFRLHTGYHYPRSAHTVDEIKQNFKKISERIQKFHLLPQKKYLLHCKEKSLIDFKTYQNILKAHKLNSKKQKINFLQNIEGAVNSNEGVFLNEKIIQFYKKII